MASLRLQALNFIGLDPIFMAMLPLLGVVMYVGCHWSLYVTTGKFLTWPLNLWVMFLGSFIMGWWAFHFLGVI